MRIPGCPVCFQPTDEKVVRDTGIEVVCRGCGRFLISHSLVKSLGHHMFDFRSARQRLQERQQVNLLPMLGAGDEDLLFRK